MNSTIPLNHTSPRVSFCNSDTETEAVVFTNEITIDHDGWAQLAPFGDYPGHAILRQSDGSFTKFPALQRFDRAAAETLVTRFKSPWQRMKRYFTGCPIYAGHPDVPAFANEYPDKTPKGMIVDLQVRADGLFCKPVFTDEGSDLVESRKLRAFSAYWSAHEIGDQPGADGRTLKIFHPDTLKSAGLTNHPNLPVHLLNEAQTKPSPIVKKQILVEFLASQGITIANEATDEQFAAALQQIAERAAAAETAVAAKVVELEATRVDLANERQSHLNSVLDHAVGSGRITSAQRPDWATRLQTDFANESAALGRLVPALKTVAVTLQAGARKAEIANATERRDAVDTLVKAEMAANGGDYDRAFAAVQKANPALFSAMKQPARV